MRSKILSFSFLTISLGIIYITMSSDVNGIYNQGTTCASCHGNANTATTVALTGLPTTYTPGTTYNLTFTVTNPTLQKAGFNIKCSAGTFSAGTGSKTNTSINNQITHTAPMSTTSSMSPFVETFNFTWTAPTTITAITFNCAGNAVNGDNNDSNLDQWNTANYTVQGSNPTSVNQITFETVSCFPNPAKDFLTLNGIQDIKKLTIFNLLGSNYSLSYQKVNNGALLNIQDLADGHYFLRIEQDNGQTIVKNFIKQ